MALDYFRCYHSYLNKIAKLSDQEVGRLFRALLKYSDTGELQELAGRESVAFDFIADDIDSAKKAYTKKSTQNTDNIKKRWGDTNAYEPIRTYTADTNAYEEKEKKKEEKSPPLVPPSLLPPITPIISPPYNPPKKEEKTKEKEFHSFIHSDEKNSDEINFKQRQLLKGVVMLSEDQIGDLLDKLSLDEFDRYIDIIANAERSGHKYTKKTHYQAILDMARKDREIEQKK